MAFAQVAKAMSTILRRCKYRIPPFFHFFGSVIVTVIRPTNMTDLSAIWQEIETIRSQRTDYGFDVAMNDPVTIDQIEQRLARVLGYAIPTQLQCSLLTYNGLDPKGTWFDRYQPLSVEGIIRHWKNDRQGEQEAQAEGDEVTRLASHIPIMDDPTLHHKIYMDGIDGSIMNYVVDGIYFEEFRYSTYEDFLLVAKKYLISDMYFEWPDMA